MNLILYISTGPQYKALPSDDFIFVVNHSCNSDNDLWWQFSWIIIIIMTWLPCLQIFAVNRCFGVMDKRVKAKGDGNAKSILCDYWLAYQMNVTHIQSGGLLMATGCRYLFIYLYKQGHLLYKNNMLHNIQCTVWGFSSSRCCIHFQCNQNGKNLYSRQWKGKKTLFCLLHGKMILQACSYQK